MSTTNLTTDPRIIDTTTLPGRFVTVHTIRPVTGVNLNAGEDGAPKQMLLGSTNRMRVSSQARKRAMRTWTHEFINDTDRAARTRHTPKLVADLLASEYGRDADEAISTAAACLVSIGGGFTITAATIGRTDETAFVPGSAPATLARVIDAHWDDLRDARNAISVIRDEAAAAEADPAAPKKRGRAAKADKVTLPKQTLPVAIRKELEAAFAPGASLEIALNGRMLTALPDTGSVYAASSVAHSYSVDPVNLLNDTWSIKDDWQDGGVFGAAHYASGRDARVLASGTLYEWASLDREQLRTNLAAAHPEAADLDAACADAERLFVSSAVWAIPQAAAHTTGSMTPPTFAVVTCSTTQPVTASCFTSPVTGDNTPADAADRLAAYLTSTNRFLPATGGLALHLPLAGEQRPDLPETFTWL